MLAFWMQIGFLISCIYNGFTEGISHERVLIRKLHKSHSTDIRPQPASLDGPTVVNMSIKLTQILDIDEKNEILSILAWVSMKWEDTTFTWDPGSHGNLHKLSFPASNIWVPDVILYNTNDISLGFRLGLPQSSEDQQFYAIAKANGSVQLGFPQVFKSSCKLNIGEYPFDQQSCILQFGSWSYDSTELLINVIGGEIVKENVYFITNKAWQKVGSRCTSSLVRCAFQDNAKCSVVTCNLEIKRTAWFEVISYTLPTIIIAVLSLMVFIVPPEAGKRMEVGITLILCVAVYLSLINKKMPSTSDSFPLVSQFYGCVIVEITIAMVCSCYCLHIYDPEGLRLLHFPNYLRTLAFGVLSRMIFYKTDGGKPNRVHPTKEIKTPERKRNVPMKTNNNKLFVRSAPTVDLKEPVKDDTQVKMEDIEEYEVNHVKNGKTRASDAGKGNTEKSHRKQTVEEEELQVEEVPEQASEPTVDESFEQEANTSQEIRCDSGFGEPEGKITSSTRSSLVSNKSVALQSTNSSPILPAENENEQNVKENSGTDEVPQDLQNSNETDPRKIANKSEKQPTETSAISVYSHAAGGMKRAMMLTRSMTTVFKPSRGLVPASLTARPYTDSALQNWSSHNKHASIKSAAALHHEFMQARKKKKELSNSVLPEQVRSESVLETLEAAVIEGNMEDGIAAGEKTKVRKISKQQNNVTHSIQEDEGVVPKQVIKNEQDAPLSSRSVKLNSNAVTMRSSKDGLTNDDQKTRQGNSKEKPDGKTKPVSKRKLSSSKPALDKKISNSSLVHEHVEMQEAPNTPGKLSHRNSSVSKGDVAEQSPKDDLKSIRIAPTVREAKKESKKSLAIRRKLSAHNSEITIDLVEKIKDEENKTTDFDSKQTDDAARSEAKDVQRTPSNGVNKNEAEPKNLFAQRKWTTLRENIRDNFTVKDIFGQILTPEEKNPIIAIANVLLRDQRKYTMRTEWMTSAMIFNRFFIILLAFAVVISMLAVFLQSSRIRNSFS